ncbi:shikimate kinase [Mangrovimonas sp. CR14]|uniref:shikimate kinase n=1 Tax=Mangrovimonas sp. CR14 TaxID=2706120 RepID=UPI00141E415C|nr:shikimate kinase [Mangrovimonas sp. CR14]NIK92946.1 shikimate kinase [Mangrovimonas sp. CR14]
MKIILMGYMASGKSLIGRQLAKDLSVAFIDLDHYIEQKEAKSIGEIFFEKGEIYFRKREHFYLKELLEGSEKFVLSLGGGTPCFSNNAELLFDKNHLNSFFLNVPLSELLPRLMKEKSQRPLISHIHSEEEMAEFIGKHLFERLPFYNRADHKINANQNVDKVIEDIVVKLF